MKKKSILILSITLSILVLQACTTKPKEAEIVPFSNGPSGPPQIGTPTTSQPQN